MTQHFRDRTWRFTIKTITTTKKWIRLTIAIASFNSFFNYITEVFVGTMRSWLHKKYQTKHFLKFETIFTNEIEKCSGKKGVQSTITVHSILCHWTFVCRWKQPQQQKAVICFNTQISKPHRHHFQFELNQTPLKHKLLK